MKHLIELLFLVVVERLAHTGDGAFAYGMNLLDLVGPRHSLIADHAHGLLSLVNQDRFDLARLVIAEIEFLRERSDLLVDRRR